MKHRTSVRRRGLRNRAFVTIAGTTGFPAQGVGDILEGLLEFGQEGGGAGDKLQSAESHAVTFDRASGSRRQQQISPSLQVLQQS
jgi:hypothetical protein